MCCLQFRAFKRETGLKEPNEVMTQAEKTVAADRCLRMTGGELQWHGCALHSKTDGAIAFAWCPMYGHAGLVWV